MWISWCQRSVAAGDVATEAMSVSLESLLTSDIRIKLIHIAARAQSYRKTFVFTKPHSHKTVTKPSKSSSESESSVHWCHAAVKTRENVKEWRNKLDKNWTNQPDIREWRRLTCAEIICECHRKRHRMYRHRFMCARNGFIQAHGFRGRPGGRYRPVRGAIDEGDIGR